MECGAEPTATEVTEQVRDGIAGDRMAAARVRRTADSLEQRVDRENHIGAAMRELFGGLR